MGAYKEIREDYFQDTYRSIIREFSAKYEMDLRQIQQLMTLEMCIKIITDANYDIEKISINAFKLIQIRLFLSDYDVIPPVSITV